MTAPLWVLELTAAFWELAGDEPFPRNLRSAIARSLPVSVVSLPILRVTSIDSWLSRQNVLCQLPASDSMPSGYANRRLRACLVAYRDQGIIFLDGTDPEREQRFSLAHELGHYLRHYWWPRRQATERLGAPILQVFDGDRPPREEEQVHAVLASVTIGMHVHLMDRAGGKLGAVTDAEREADRLAYELLAPSALVLGGPWSGDILETLMDVYGLPARPAGRYARLLIGEAPRTSSLIRLLKLED